MKTDEVTRRTRVEAVSQRTLKTTEEKLKVKGPWSVSGSAETKAPPARPRTHVSGHKP
jgi:hypothetical protein